MKEEDYQSVIKVLANTKSRESKRWATYFLGVQLAVGNTKLYAAKGKAKRILIDRVKYSLDFGPVHRDREELYKDASVIIEELERKGLLEFRQLDDRSPRFPYNISGISKEQQDKLAAMLDASDMEMTQLAIKILQELKSQPNEPVLPAVEITP
jgi:hypothetical protein